MSVFKLRVEPELIRRASLFWMLVLETYWITLVLVAKPAPSAGSVQVLTVVIGVAVALAAWRAGAALADGLRVLTTLRTPAALWQAWLRKIAVTLATRWALAVVAGTVAVMRHGAPWMWSGPVALYSAVLVVALAASIAQRGLWHWAWTWLIAGALAIVIALARWHGLDAWMEAAPAGHLALALACVGATAAVLAHWRTPPLPRTGERRVPGFDPVRHVLNYTRRFTVLKVAGGQLSTSKGKGRGYVAMVVAGPIVSALCMRLGSFNARWGDSVGAGYVFIVIFLMVFVQTSVACKDLHWRRLLAPQGFARGRLGSHLIRSTLELNLLAVAVAAALAAVLLIALRWAGMQIDPLAIAHGMLPYSVVVLEYVMAICVAVALRSVSHAMLAYVFLVLIALVGLWSTMRGFIDPLKNMFVIGPAYVGCLLAVTAIAIVCANRLWTVGRLLAYIDSRASPVDGHTPGGRWFPWPGRTY